MRGILNRRWLRFGTRTLLCLVALVAVFSVIAGRRIRESERIRLQRQEELQQELSGLISCVEKRRIFEVDIRGVALRRLAEIGPPARRALPVLQKLANDKDLQIAKGATDAIASIEQPERSLLSRLLTWDWDD